MLCSHVRKADGHHNERNIGVGEYRDKCAQGGTLRRLGDGGPYQQVTEIEQKAHQLRGQSQVPGPPDAPLTPAPYATGGEINEHEHGSDLNASDRDRIIQEIFLREKKNTRDEGDREEDVRDQRRRDVNEEDAKNGSLERVVRQLHEDCVQVP